jgi:hypothetical protein
MQIFMVVAVVLAATGLVVMVDAQKAQRFFCDGSFFFVLLVFGCGLLRHCYPGGGIF